MTAPFITKKWFCAAIFLGLSLSIIPAILRAEEPGNWAGQWQTRWRGGGARIELHQEGQTVTGAYPLLDGFVEGTASGRELVGTWHDSSSHGSFTFVQARDGRSFTGRFDSGEWWTGTRIDTAADTALDQSSPMETMRSFLTIANMVDDGNGTIDQLGQAARVIDLDKTDRGLMSRLDYARLLFDVLDHLTFRLWSLPHDPQADAAQIQLRQAGSDKGIELQFTRLDDRWFIVGPDVGRLRNLLDRLEATGGRAQTERQEPAELRLDTPRDSVKSFILGMDRPSGPDPSAYKALNASELNASIRSQEIPLLARYLKEALDRIGYIIWQEIPDDPHNHAPYVHFEHPAGDIVVAPVETDKGIIWQFTPATLRNIRKIYAAIDEMPLPPGLSEHTPDDPYFRIRDIIRGHYASLLRPLGPMETWQWVGLGLFLVLGAATGVLLSAGIARYIRAHDELFVGHMALRLTVLWPVRLVALGAFLFLSLYAIGPTATIATFLKASALILVLIGMVPLLWRGMGRLADLYRESGGVIGHQTTLLSFIVGLSRLVMVLSALLLIANALAIPYQGVIAGLGIGGIAVALAARPTLENFISGFTLYADRPLSVGDTCRFGTQIGTVEHIGMRSTRIRSLDRTLITVPNSVFSNMQLENFARRDRFWFKTELQLRRETTPDQLRHVLVELRKLFLGHPMVTKDPCRVRLIGFGAHSVDIEIFVYIHTADNGEFYAVREDLLLRIMDVIESSGTQIALPSMVQYRSEDRGLAADAAQQAEQTVAMWRREGRLPFPDWPAEEKTALENSLDYPAEGSLAGTQSQPPLPFSPAPPPGHERPSGAR